MGASLSSPHNLLQVLAQLFTEIISPSLIWMASLWEEVDPSWDFELTALSKALDSAYGPLHVVLASGLCKAQSCMHPANARRATYSTAGGACTSRSDEQFKKASCPMRRSLLARLSRSSCEQCAKVDPKISLISVRERSTQVGNGSSLQGHTQFSQI